MKRNYFKKIIKTFGYLDFFSFFCTTKTIKQKEMDKKSNVRVVGFPKETYDKALQAARNGIAQITAYLSDQYIQHTGIQETSL